MQGIGIEHPVAAQVGQIVRAGIAGQADQAQHVGPHRRLPAARPFPRLARLGAAQQPGGDGHGAKPERKLLQRGKGGNVVTALCLQQHVGQDFAQQQVAVAVLHRLDAGQQPRLAGEGRKQPLRKGVDRVDPQPAAGAIEHFGKQPPRLFLRRRTIVRADGLQVLRQRHGIGPHPARQHFVDPRRHFGCARLGEGQAEDLIRAHAVLQQQAQHAGGKHLGLSGAGRGGEPDHFARIDRRVLFVGQGEKPAHPSASPRACHSSSRINWS